MSNRVVSAALAAGLALLSAGAGSADGQTTQPTTTGVATANYADPAFGFELTLPAGWEYDRTRFQQFKDSIGLLRGRSPGGVRGLQVVVFRSFSLKPFEDWMVDFGKAVAELTDTPRVDWETWRLPPRAGAILSLTSKIGVVSTRTHYLCVPFDPSTVWVLVYSGSFGRPEEQDQIRWEFDQLAASLRVHYDPEEIERLAPALDRGKALLERVRQQGAQARVDETEYVYDMTIAGKPAGYLSRRVTREEFVYSAPDAKRRYAKEGLRVRERSWRFAEDGTAWYARVDLFSSFDGQSELIENEQSQVPPPEVQPQEVFVRMDKTVREAGVLASSYTTSRDTVLPDPGKPVSVGPVYMDQAWVRLLPGLLLGAPEEPVAVAVYHLDSRVLLAHAVQPLGRQPLGGFDGPTYAFEVRDGFIGKPSKLYCDERGSLLKLEAGDLVLTRVARAEIEKKYGARRDEIRRRWSIGEP